MGLSNGIDLLGRQIRGAALVLKHEEEMNNTPDGSLWEGKIWGKVQHTFVSDKASISYLHTTQGRCSVHYHQHRHNFFQVILGKIEIISVGMSSIPSRFILPPGESTRVYAGIPHWFRVIEPAEVIELYWTTDGHPVRIDDIVRFDIGQAIDNTDELLEEVTLRRMKTWLGNQV